MKNILLPAFLLWALSASSQKEKFEEGHLVTQSGDTLRGLISWKKKSELYDRLLFKKSEEGELQSYNWNQLRDVFDKQGKSLVKVLSVTRTLEYIDGNDYTIRLKDSIAEGPVPLIPLYTGRKLSLYYFYDKAPFYFLYDGKNIRQLVQKYRYLTQVERMFDYEKGRRFQITDEYKGLLASYYDFSQDRKMRYILDNTLYEDRGFVYLISKMDSKLR